MHGAKELDMSIEEYFSRGEYVAEGQILMQKKFRTDCLYPFFYASVEMEAMGGDVYYSEDGPPLSAAPIFRNPADINSMAVPEVESSASLGKVLDAIRLLKAESGDNTPIIGVVMSPFSVPIMQLGFNKYLDLLDESPEIAEILLEKNRIFCREWANAQIAAGAHVICYFDPMASSTMTSRDIYKRWGYESAKKVIGEIHAPVVTHLASGRAIPVMDLLLATGSVGLGVSAEEDLADLKNACRGNAAVIGNLNGIEMRRWTAAEAKEKVKDLILKAGAGGGFIIADNHGEIPYQVPDRVLHAVADAIDKWGRYPLEG